jgi:uncharacterized protein
MPLYTLALRFPDTDDRRSEVRSQHRDYLESLSSAGKLVAAGPWGHDHGHMDHGAMIIYQAADSDEARKLLDNDPYAAAGLMLDAELHEWQPVVGNASAMAR